MGKIHGVVNGQVLSTDDPDKQGRVQVSLPYLGGQNQSCWAPVATMMAGGGTGSWFMPEVGHEVLIAFNQSDVNHPYIIGFMWNGQDGPPDPDPQNRIIATPGGHTLRFQDAYGSKKIILQSSSGQTITLDDSGSGTITLQGGGRILTMSEGTLQIS